MGYKNDDFRKADVANVCYVNQITDQKVIDSIRFYFTHDRILLYSHTVLHFNFCISTNESRFSISQNDLEQLVHCAYLDILFNDVSVVTHRLDEQNTETKLFVTDIQN